MNKAELATQVAVEFAEQAAKWLSSMSQRDLRGQAFGDKVIFPDTVTMRQVAQWLDEHQFVQQDKQGRVFDHFVGKLYWRFEIMRYPSASSGCQVAVRQAVSSAMRPRQEVELLIEQLAQALAQAGYTEKDLDYHYTPDGDPLTWGHHAIGWVQALRWLMK